MKYNIYGRFQVEVRREGDAWTAYRLEPGKRVVLPELVIPADLAEQELDTWLDDIYHELAGPGQDIERLDDTRH